VPTGLFAQLRGSHEVGGAGQLNAGDPDGRGSFSALIPSPGKLCFGYEVTGIAKPVAAHIHKGKAGEQGPVVITLRRPRSGNPGTVSGCVRAGRRLLANIRRRAGNYYPNVHTADFPGGAVRGQLFHPTHRQDK
jgi:hypothetical protein